MFEAAVVAEEIFQAEVAMIDLSQTAILNHVFMTFASFMSGVEAVGMVINAGPNAFFGNYFKLLFRYFQIQTQHGGGCFYNSGTQRTN